jgi:hypothetical protein
MGAPIISSVPVNPWKPPDRSLLERFANECPVSTIGWLMAVMMRSHAGWRAWLRLPKLFENSDIRLKGLPGDGAFAGKQARRR